MDFDRQHAHRLLDQLGSGQLAAVVKLLEVMTDRAEEPLTQEDRTAIAVSREWFDKNPDGIAFEQVVADCGLTMDEIRDSKGN
jgi:hypothetical protein